MQFRERERLEISLASHPSQGLFRDCSALWIVYSCQGGPGVQRESSAVKPPGSVEVIYCHLLLPTATACSLAATDHPFRSVLCLAYDSASIEKVIDQMELKNNYYMMTPKRLRIKKVFRNKDRSAGGKCQVRWGIFE